MESNQNTELISQAIQKLLEEKRNKIAASDGFAGNDDDDHRLLCKLLSQLDSLEPDGSIEQTLGATRKKAVSSHTKGEKENPKDDCVEDEIMKEIKEVKKQNSITHWLLSVMIVLTLTWQLSEFSLLLKLRDGLSDPFRSFGNMLVGMVKRSRKNVLDAEKQLIAASKEHDNNINLHIEPPSLSSLKIPELPCLDLRDFGFHDDE